MTGSMVIFSSAQSGAAVLSFGSRRPARFAAIMGYAGPGTAGKCRSRTIQSSRAAITFSIDDADSCQLAGNAIRNDLLMKDTERHRRFDALVRRHADDLYRFAIWLCGDATLARDLVQESFMRAWKALDKLKDGSAAKSWLITILRREFARTFERKVPPQTNIDNVIVAEESELPPDDRAERALLRQAMLELDVSYREPLMLQVVMGLSITEIADQLELTESAVMTRVFRAREQLKARLQSDSGQQGNVHELS
jgi:RNA polymerase sigma-70 factor, ECF subfamily